MVEDRPTAQETPLVSVIMAAYNAEDTIRRALDSVAAQTYSGIAEVIVVDDGSDDATSDIVREEYPSVTLIVQENRGSAQARNNGVAAASNELIAFIDADDEWLADKTEMEAELFSTRDDIALSLAGCIRLPPAHREPEATPSCNSEDLLQTVRFEEVFPGFDFHYGCSGWMVRRCLFEDLGGFLPDMRRSQDTEFLWRVLLAGHGVVRIRRPLYRYYPSFARRDPDDVARTLRTWYRCLAPVVEDYAVRASGGRKILSEEDTERCLYSFYWKAAKSLWGVGERAMARDSYSRAAHHADHLGIRGRVRCRLAAWSPRVYEGFSRMLASVGY